MPDKSAISHLHDASITVSGGCAGFFLVIGFELVDSLR